MKKRLLVFILISTYVLAGGVVVNKLELLEKKKPQKEKDIVSTLLEEKELLIEKTIKRVDKEQKSQIELVNEEIQDIDGNSYKVVKIGDQYWMGENLKVTKYNDGSDIPLVTNKTIWASNDANDTNKPMMCWYENNEAKYKEVYGALYNWYAISTTTNENKNVCPVGWHVSSDEEWENLIKFVSKDKGVGNRGGEYVRSYESDDWTEVGKYLKSKTGWENDKNGFDDYGFFGISGGKRHYDGSFKSFNMNGYWWCSTFTAIDNAWNRYLYYYNDNVNRNSTRKDHGFSIRCVKN